MDKTGVRPHVFGNIRQEGDNVVLRFLFDLQDAINGEGRLFLDVAQGLGGDQTLFSHGLTGRDLYLEPFGITVFCFPDAAHFRTCVAAYHLQILVAAECLLLKRAER